MPNVSSTSPDSELIEIVYSYLKGDNLNIIRIKLEEQCDTVDAIVLYQNQPLNQSEREGILGLLYVPKAQYKNYVAIDRLYPLLAQLQLDGHGHNHLDYLLKLINEARYKRSWHIPVAILTFMSTLLGGLIYLNPSVARSIETLYSRIAPYLLNWLDKTFSLLRNLPLLGMTYSLGKLLSNLYKTLFHGATNTHQKLTTLTFQVFSGGLSLAGYVLSYLAAGVATPLAGMLFVSSALVDIVESWYIYYSIQNKPRPPTPTINTFESRANELCLRNQKEHASNTVWINVGAALFIAGAIAVWCFAPPSLPLILGCVLFISAISYIKSASLDLLNARYAKELQLHIKAIRDPMEFQSQSPQTQQVFQLQKKDIRQTDEIRQLKKRVGELEHELTFFRSAVTKPVPLFTRSVMPDLDTSRLEREVELLPVRQRSCSG